ncbi:metal ABC transporter solute-binding protein, Zn/Mn family [Rossellomorea aquimaris]|uniref:metal ABC transporter solute-binding protein, Zn/Mn family n=1 Tax=Rossellomorea aquimaris TaxID=189382 RepID=UPI0007D092B1|nr:zinc ABC transporter substrate-binding protein [Rossellomorea aquimaris]
MNYIRNSWLLLIVFFLTACGATSEQNNNEKKDTMKVYTTVYPLEDFTKKIGGKHVEVESIYPPGADEHTFEPSQKDMIKMADGDVFLYIGMGLEGFIDDAKPILEDEDVVVVPVSKNINLEESQHHDEGNEDEHDHDNNPHIWLDLVYSKQMANTIAETLSNEMPEHKELFQENLETLTADLDHLDSEFKKMVEGSSKNTFYVSHAAYSYWEERYGIKQEAIAGLNTANEPSQQELKKIIEKGKKDNVQYILFEQNVSSRLTEVVQKELGAKSLTIHNLSVLTEEDRSKEEDYFSLMKKNIQTLEKVLK